MKKKIREYHIESYWTEEACKKKRQAELTQKFIDGLIIGGFIALNTWIVYEFLVQLFEVI